MGFFTESEEQKRRRLQWIAQMEEKEEWERRNTCKKCKKIVKGDLYPYEKGFFGGVKNYICKECKGIEEENSKYPFFNGPVKNCTWCGTPFKIKGSLVEYFKCKGSILGHKGLFLCEKCAKRCKGCGKYFCPKHLEKHKCKNPLDV